MTKDGRVFRKFNLQRQVEQDLVSRLQFSQHVTPGPKSLSGNSKFFLSGHNSYHVAHILSANANHRAMFWEPGKYDFHFQSEKWKNIPK